MSLNKAHKIKLNPTNNQKIFFEKSFGTVRFTYNCHVCGNSIDRDLNASKNLANLALLGNPKEVKPAEQTQTSDSSGRLAMKQEFLFNPLNN